MDGTTVLWLIKKIRALGSILNNRYLAVAIFAEHGISAEIRPLNLFGGEELAYGERPIILDSSDGATVVGGIKIACEGADEIVEHIQAIENGFFRQCVHELAYKIRKDIEREKNFFSVPAVIKYHFGITSALFVFNERTNMFECCAASDERLAGLRVHKESSNIITECYADGTKKVADRIGLEPKYELELEHLSPFIAIPIGDGQNVGALLASGRGISRWNATALTELISEIGVYIENAIIVERLRSEAQMDCFLGILSRTAIEQKIREALGDRRRHGDTAILMIDIDNFKAYNDSAGHAEGDALLKKIVEIIKRCKRSTDLLARYGGDEFILFLSNIDAAGVRKVCERIITKCARTNPNISCSIGAYVWPGTQKDIAELFKIADANLYAAKGKKGTFVLTEERGGAEEKKVYDERIFAEFLKKKEEELKRYAIPFGLLSCDVSDGAKALSLVRGSDVVGFYNGKVGIILSNTRREEAEVVAKRLESAGIKCTVVR